MNYYERIQKSVDYIESNLKNNIEIESSTGSIYVLFKLLSYVLCFNRLYS